MLTETLGVREVSYPPDQLFDGETGSAWVEGAPGTGVGETVTFVTDRAVSALEFVNGFARTERLYLRNGRPRRLRVTMIAAFTAPGLVSELDVHRCFAREIGTAVEMTLDDTRAPQRRELPVTGNRQHELYRRALETFLADYPFFAAEMARELGFPPPDELSDADRREFLRLAEAAYGMRCVRLEIAAVYPGTHYSDTCLSEISVIFE
jgi:hypothetical protein